VPLGIVGYLNRVSVTVESVYEIPRLRGIDPNQTVVKDVHLFGPLILTVTVLCVTVDVGPIIEFLGYTEIRESIV
jgi:hypothetical protein